jgi:hypothetical protein
LDLIGANVSSEFSFSALPIPVKIVSAILC